MSVHGRVSALFKYCLLKLALGNTRLTEFESLGHAFIFVIWAFAAPIAHIEMEVQILTYPKPDVQNQQFDIVYFYFYT